MQFTCFGSPISFMTATALRNKRLLCEPWACLLGSYSRSVGWFNSRSVQSLEPFRQTLLCLFACTAMLRLGRRCFVHLRLHRSESPRGFGVCASLFLALPTILVIARIFGLVRWVARPGARRRVCAHRHHELVERLRALRRSAASNAHAIVGLGRCSRDGGSLRAHARPLAVSCATFSYAYRVI